MSTLVSVTVINNTGNSITLNSSNLEWGAFKSSYPEETLYGSNNPPKYNPNGQIAFIAEGTSIFSGTQGKVSYNLPDNSILTFFFNNPIINGGEGSPNNDFIYPLMTNIPLGGGVQYYAVSNWDNGDSTISVVITINSALV